MTKYDTPHVKYFIPIFHSFWNLYFLYLCFRHQSLFKQQWRLLQFFHLIKMIHKKFIPIFSFLSLIMGPLFSICTCCIPGTNPCSNNNGGCSHSCHPAPGGGVNCTCPDFAGLVLRNKNRMCVPPNNCTEGNFVCGNNKCIPMAWACDKDNDCGDNTDEDPRFCREFFHPLLFVTTPSRVRLSRGGQGHMPLDFAVGP